MDFFRKPARIIQKVSFTLLAVSMLFLAAPQMALAAAASSASGPFSSTQSQTEACEGIDVGSGNPCTNDTSGSTLGGIINAIINIMSLIIGALAVIMIIVAGFKFVTSGGESQKVASAKNALIYAIVGLLVAALGQILIHFVLTTTNGAAPCPTNSSVATSSPKC